LSLRLLSRDHASGEERGGELIDEFDRTGTAIIARRVDRRWPFKGSTFNVRASRILSFEGSDDTGHSEKILHFVQDKL